MPRVYFVCPECGRKRVSFYLGRNGEDYYRCDHCEWGMFAPYPQETEFDREKQRALTAANPGVEIFGG